METRLERRKVTKRPQRWQARGAWRLLCGAAILACASAAPGAGLPPAEDLRRDSLEMAREGHPVVVLYVQHACPWCERALAYLVPMSRSAPRQAAFRQVDLHASRTLIDFGGRRTTERRFAQAEGIRFTPMLVIYGPGGERLAEPIAGMPLPEYYGHYVEQAIRRAHERLSGKEHDQSGNP